MFWYGGSLNEGTALSLSVADPGLLFGATVFTTLRVYEGSLDHPMTVWRSHVSRLQASIAAFLWCEPDWAMIQHEVSHLAHHYPVIRITLFPDGRELITGRSLPPNLGKSQKNGVSAWLVQGQQFDRPMPGHKTGNYLPAWFANAVAHRHGAQEAILSEALTGNWLETSTGNLIGWSDGYWSTPCCTESVVASTVTNGETHFSIGADSLNPSEETEPTSSHALMCKALILPGIMRSQLISWLRCHNKEIVEEPWTPTRVQTLEFIGYCNTVRQLIPIHTVLNTDCRFVFDAQHECLGDLVGLMLQ
jgi:4-amino-4-deoxychorismate lyase